MIFKAKIEKKEMNMGAMKINDNKIHLNFQTTS